MDLSFLTFSSFLSISTITRRYLCPIPCNGATVHKYPCRCCRTYGSRRILTSGDEILALRRSTRWNSATLYLLPATIANAADFMQLSMVDDMQDMEYDVECDIEYAIRHVMILINNGERVHQITPQRVFLSIQSMNNAQQLRYWAAPLSPRKACCVYYLSGSRS